MDGEGKKRGEGERDRVECCGGEEEKGDGRGR